MSVDQLANSIAHHFDVEPVALERMVGSSQRLWRSGGYVIKEFPYDASLEGKRRAARFEYEVWRSGRVPMPEPIVSREGALIVFAAGSRGTELGLRVHRWIDGAPVVGPQPRLTARAGSILRVIQEAGARFAGDGASQLQWWEGEPSAVRDRLDIDYDLQDALALMERAQQLHPIGVFTHCDHKPQNSMMVGTDIAVLDWDECGHFSPRLEAVESALRWSVVGREAERTRFVAFLDGYGFDGPLVDTDFAKWIAALVGWFTFQGRRALGDFADDTDYERAEALAMAHDALAELTIAMRSLPEWTTWLA